MVYAVVNISEETNRTLNIIKAENGLRTKSEAIDFMAKEYDRLTEDPELRPEFIKKMLRIQKEKPIYVGTLDDFRRRYEVPAADKAKTRQRVAKAPAAVPRRVRGDRRKAS